MIGRMWRGTAKSTEGLSRGQRMARFTCARLLRFTRVFALLLVCLASFAITPASAQTATVNALTGQSCAGTRFGSNLGCTANDFSAALNFTQPSLTAISTCRQGEILSIDVIASLSSASPFRYDGGIFIGEKGNDPQLNNAANSCSLGVFPLAPVPFNNTDGDSCGDFNGSSNATLLIRNVALTCTPAPGTNKLAVPFVLTYTQNTGLTCSSANIVPGTKSKCTTDVAAQMTSVTVRGYVTVNKVTSPAATAGSFAFSASSTTPVSPASASIGHGQSQTFEVDLNPTGGSKTLTITEAALGGWDPTATITCTNPSGGSAAAYVVTNNATRTITATLTPTNFGAICSVTNRKLPTITLRKTISGGSSVKADWTLAFTGSTSGSGIEGAVAVTNRVVTAGTYALSESSATTGYSLTNLSCTGTANTATSVANPQLVIANGENAICTFTNTAIAAPNFTITKAVSSASVSAPGTLTYTVTVTNTGNVSLTSPVLTDTLAQGATGLTLTSGPTLQAGSDVNSNGQIETSEVWVYSATYAVTQGNLDDGGNIVNTASFSASGLAAKTATATTTVSQTRNFTITKAVSSASVSAPGTLTYTVTVTNTGNVSLTSPALTDTLAQGATGLTLTSGPTLQAGSDVNSNGQIEPSEVWVYSATYAVTQGNLDDGGDIVNTAIYSVSGLAAKTATATTTTPGIVFACSGDNFPGNTIVGAYGSTVCSNTGATGQSGEPLSYGGGALETVWYTWTAPATGTVTFDTCSTTTNFDTTLQAFTGSAVNALSLLAQNDDSTSCTGTRSLMSFAVTAGTTYRIQVDGYANSDGTFLLSWSLPVASASISKSVSLADIGSPGTLDYTIIVSNTGTVDLTGPTLTDALTQGGSPRTLTSGPVLVSGDSSNPGVLDTGETWVYHATYDVTPADLANGGILLNTATFSSNEAGPYSDTAATTTSPTAIFTIAKTVSSASIATPGTLTYTITINNTGNVALTSPSLTDILSQGGSLLTLTSGPTLQAGSDANSNGIIETTETWVYTATYAVTQPILDDGGTIVNTANFSASGLPTQTATASTTTPGVVFACSGDNFPGNAISGASGSTICSNSGATGESGEPTSYGGGALETVWYTWTAPASGTVTFDTCGIPTNFDTTLQVFTGSAVNALTLQGRNDDETSCPATRSLIAVAVTSGTTYRIQVDGYNNDDGTFELSWNMPIASATINKSVNLATVSGLDSLVYTIIVSNTGTVDLTGPVLTDVLTQNGAARTLTSAAVVISGDTANPGTLDTGETWIYQATYDVTQTDIDDGNNLLNTATFTSNEAGPYADTATTAITQTTSFTFAKTSSTTDITTVGEVVPYTITLTNTGNVSITSITVSDPLLPGLSCTPGSGGTPSDLGVGASATCTGSYTVTQLDIDDNGGGDGTLDNTATLAATYATGGVISDTDSVAIPITRTATVDLAKSFAFVTDLNSDGLAGVGDVIRYTYIVTNTGNVLLSNLSINDVANGNGDAPDPQHISRTDNLPTGDSPDSDSDPGNWTMLGPGDVVTFTWDYTVVQADVDLLQ
jgi:uncharacterized repeat protein (TIGR01451 family)